MPLEHGQKSYIVHASSYGWSFHPLSNWKLEWEELVSYGAGILSFPFSVQLDAKVSYFLTESERFAAEGEQIRVDFFEDELLYEIIEQLKLDVRGDIDVSISISKIDELDRCDIKKLLNNAEIGVDNIGFKLIEKHRQERRV